MAELRTVVPDGVGIVDGDGKRHVCGGRHVAGEDAVGGRVAWLFEAGLCHRMILMDGILMLIFSL